MKQPIMAAFLLLAIISFTLNFSSAQTPTPSSSDSVPSVSLHHPPNASNRSNSTVEFACNATDDRKLDNVTLYTNYTAWNANQTNSTPANNTLHNFTAIFADGIYSWNCLAVDNASNATFASSNFTFMVDAAAPQYASNQTNSTANGTSVLFSLYWNDSLSALSRFIFSFDNGTGSFTNDSAVAFTSGASSGTSNATKFVNQTNASTIRWIVYAWDSAGNSNVSQTYSFVTNSSTTAADTQAPQYSANQTNSTIAGQAVKFSLYWTDETALSNYTFSFDNGTGSFTNDSVATFSGTTNHSNVTKIINSTVGSTIRWRVWANDSSNNMNASPIYTLTTTAASTTNTAPYLVTTPSISPDPADNTTALSCLAKFADSTNSSLTYIYTWYKTGTQNTTLDVNKTSVSNNTEATASSAVPIALLSAASTWVCKVRAFDGSLYSDYYDSATVEILASTSNLVNRVTISCPSTLTNQAGTVTVSYYSKSKLTCSGITVVAKNSVGTDVSNATLGGQKCLASTKAQYSVNFTSSGTYTVTASAGGSSSSCIIEYKGVSLLSTRVPDFNPLLLPLVAIAALGLARKYKLKEDK